MGWSEEEDGEDGEETNWVLEGHEGGGRESRIERRGMGEEGSLVCLCFDK